MAGVRRGPAREPTALKILKGAKASRINKREATPPAGVVKMPTAGMDKRARQVWRRLAPDLERLGLLTVWDVDALAAYCRAVSLVERAAADIEANGIITQGDRGRARNPACVVERDAGNQMLRFGMQFGLTPSARATLELPASVTPAGTEGEADDILTG